MKKIFLAGALALLGAVSANAQEGFKLGAHVGLPIGDAGDAYSFKLGVDAAYMWPIADSFYAGIGTGYQAWMGKEYSYGGVSFKPETLSVVPVVATAQYNVADNFALGLDLGYGFAFAGGESDGGFYYQPKVAYNLGDSGQLWLGYQGVSSDGSTLGAINLGYAIGIGN